MKKESKNSSPSIWSRFKQYLSGQPFVVFLPELRDGISEKLRQLILGFFDCLSPCWNFLFLDKSKLADEPVDNGPIDAKSQRLEKNNFSTYEIHSY